jgi:hypothetical protein
MLVAEIPFAILCIIIAAFDYLEESFYFVSLSQIKKTLPACSITKRKKTLHEN